MVEKGLQTSTVLRPLFKKGDGNNISEFNRKDGELLLCVWDFLDFNRKIIGEPALGFEDILRGFDPANPSGSDLPGLSDVYFDEIGILLTQLLLRELRVRMGFDGIKNNNAVHVKQGHVQCGCP